MGHQLYGGNLEACEGISFLCHQQIKLEQDVYWEELVRQ
jgi:hypothetical protein